MASASSVGFQEPPTLGYHKIRGLAAPLRMMFYYKQQAFKNVAYGEDMGEKWFAGEKEVLRPKNACINLPYITVNSGDTVITQSNTCLLYIAKMLQIDDAALFFENHTVVDQVMDWRNELMKIVYPFDGKVKTGDAFPAAAEAHMETVKKTHLSKLENFCKAGPYMCGTATPQSGDFHLWEMLDQHCQICDKLGIMGGGVSGLLAEFPKLRALYSAFKALPALGAYFQSDMYATYAHNNGVFTHFTGFDKESFVYGGSENKMVAMAG